jgi:hypothetical protein
VKLQKFDFKNQNNMTRNPIQKIKKKLTMCEALMPVKCTSKNSGKRILANCEEIIRRKISSDHLLKVTSDFEKLKLVLLSDSHRNMFKHIKNHTIEEHLKIIKEEEVMFLSGKILIKEKLENLNINENNNIRDDDIIMQRIKELIS